MATKAKAQGAPTVDEPVPAPTVDEPVPVPDKGGWIDGELGQLLPRPNEPTAPPTATGAAAGTPGTFTPAGSTVATFADMTGIAATPATAWATGEYVVCDDASECFWDGTAWASGRAP